MGYLRGLAVAGLALLVGHGPARADEPMDGTFRAGRACEALVSIRKEPRILSFKPKVHAGNAATLRFSCKTTRCRLHR